ncbi:uncharacterized protein LOC106161480 [Lingula anatina]|uniref:Uncharacterized protein LOC106161480 n=1 Tax=Lingula anatina TaxID=7574 RepID=A0A1S3I6Q9_LINAN|nr:uncharacterized protein LOC106161480 [Lingula anatina]|eukprot:XP_013393893.1 uncharacterized protein LOC106161480 [Lingula anatina]
MKVLCVVVLCLAATFASAKTLDERVARMLMEDEEFKRSLRTKVCDAIESVISRVLSCDNVSEDRICGLVVNVVGSYFGATKAACKLAIPNSLINTLQAQCSKVGSFENVNVC